MRFGTPLAAAAVALGLAVFGSQPRQAQDIVPPVSKDTSKAAKVRPDTAAQAYKPMGTPADCPAPDAAVAARLPGDTTPVSQLPADTTPVSQLPADTTARDTVTVAQVDSAQRAAAEAVGVYHPPAKPPKVAAAPCPVPAAKADSVTGRPVTPDSAPATPQPADTAKPR